MEARFETSITKASKDELEFVQKGAAWFVTKNITMKIREWLFVCNVQVNNFSVMLGRSHRFLGISSTFGE